MTRSLSLIIGILALLVVTACSMPKQSWTQGMRGMAQAVEGLLPYVYNKKRFSNPENKKIIKVKVAQLNLHAESLDRHVARGLSGNDPLFTTGLKGLKRNLRRSADSFHVDSYDYSRKLLQNSMNFCVKCHMANPVGRKLPVYDQFAEGSLQGVDTLERAKAKVALRQFSEAVDLLKQAMSQSGLSSQEKMENLEFLLAISLRNSESLEDGRQSLQIALKDPALGKYREAMTSWLKDIRRWDGMDQSMTLKKAMQVRYAGQKKHFVRTLKQSLYLHQALREQTDRAKRSQILWALGKVYQVQASLGFWELPEQYFEACIEQWPHSSIAQRCFFALDKEVRRGLKIGINDPLPSAERSYLIKLEALAKKSKSRPSGTGGYQEL